jgi:DNA (cytosine-5)-methyltransferase 1
MIQRELKYISLFSSAGIGCYGFLKEDFTCVATVELLRKRMEFQKINNKCKFESGYISEDITKLETKQKIKAELLKHGIKKNTDELDVLIATPPCQGMSVANHKKNNELGRNSLVIESVNLVKDLKPKVFIFENVRSFLNTECTDLDGINKSIKEAIIQNLSSEYLLHFEVLNFKNYGCPSSRTRSLVIGTKKTFPNLNPLLLFPNPVSETTLKQTIAHLPRLINMGEISKTDIYHSFKKYKPIMTDWISNLKEGESAFDNKNPLHRPHKIIGSEIIPNQNKNGDKYRKQIWDKVAPCVHTRNDILSSQNTVHPEDNRVFSIRELMLMMSIPNDFKWTWISLEKLNSFSTLEKEKFLSKEEMTIRHSIGEAVPTIIFQSIAKKIKSVLNEPKLVLRDLNNLITEKELNKTSVLNDFITKNQEKYSLSTLFKIAELSNSRRNENAAFYTSQEIVNSIIEELPSFYGMKELNILEPSVGIGNFLPLLLIKYKHIPRVRLDVIDIDEDSIEILKSLLALIHVPSNFEINFIIGDFLLTETKLYDLVIGNPPFKKVTIKDGKLAQYKKMSKNNETNNLFAFFIEKAISISNYAALVVPKSIINSPEFNITREIIAQNKVLNIFDYGELGFRGVKIETVSLNIKNEKPDLDHTVKIKSLVSKSEEIKKQKYIFDKSYPYWLIYRNENFDKVASTLKFGVFKAFRDRQITKSNSEKQGKIRVLKSRNITSNKIIDIPGYDTFTSYPEKFIVGKYLNNNDIILVPNLTYYPRACFMPPNCIADGSVALLTNINSNIIITKEDLAYFNTKEFEDFYRIARNLGTRSLNIDKNSVYFFGIKSDIHDD